MDTRQQLIDSATELVRTRGYNGFSYADLAERVGVRKASIHHHFPTKQDLGTALVAQYSERFGLALAGIAGDPGSSVHKLREYARLYRTSLTQRLGCLCGTLASEVDVVPEPVAEGVRRFMEHNLEWLRGVIAEGQAAGEILDSPSAAVLAMTVLSICQGALLVARSTHDVAGFDRAVDGVLASAIRRP